MFTIQKRRPAITFNTFDVVQAMYTIAIAMKSKKKHETFTNMKSVLCTRVCVCVSTLALFGIENNKSE